MAGVQGVRGQVSGRVRVEKGGQEPDHTGPYKLSQGFGLYLQS